MTRYREDAMRDLVSIEARIASQRKSAKNTTNRKTAKIADAVLKSLTRKAKELEAEIETLPHTPPRQFYADGNNIKVISRDTFPTEEELVAFDIPKFLRRTEGHELRGGNIKNR